MYGGAFCGSLLFIFPPRLCRGGNIKMGGCHRRPPPPPYMCVVLILNIYFVFVSCSLIAKTSERHVFIYLLLYFSDPFLLLNKRINHSIRKERKRKRRFLVTPLSALQTTDYTHNMLLNMQIRKTERS